MRQFLQDENGATAIEYAFICALMVLAMLAGLLALGSNVANNYNHTANEVSRAMH